MTIWNVVLTVAPIVVGWALSELGGGFKAAREARIKQRETAREFEVEVLRELLAAINTAYMAGSKLALRCDELHEGADWATREPYVIAVGEAITEARGCLAQAKPSSATTASLELIDALANLTGQQPTSQIILYWKRIESDLIDPTRLLIGDQIRTVLTTSPGRRGRSTSMLGQ